MNITNLTRLRHDLRTPMSGILMSAEILEAYSDSLNKEKREELLRQIILSVQEMIQVLEATRFQELATPEAK